MRDFSRGGLCLLIAEPVSNVPYTSVEPEENLATHPLKTVLDVWIVEVFRVSIKENMVITICIRQMLQYGRVNHSILGGEVLLLLK